jgi:chromosome segregation ATPase
VLEELTCQEVLISVMESESLAMKNQLNELQQLKEQESAVSASTMLGLREQLDKLEQENTLLGKDVEAERIETTKVRLQLEFTEKNFAKSAEKVVTLEEQLSELKISHAETDKAKAVAEQRAQTFSNQVAQCKESLKKADVKIAECDSVLVKTTSELHAALAAQQKAEGIAEQMVLRIQESLAANDQLRSELATVRQEAATTAENMGHRLEESNATIRQLRAESDKCRIESTISLEKKSLDLQKSTLTIEQLQNELASAKAAAGEFTATTDQ